MQEAWSEVEVGGVSSLQIGCGFSIMFSTRIFSAEGA
jgi:hypothetical protein